MLLITACDPPNVAKPEPKPENPETTNQGLFELTLTPATLTLPAGVEGIITATTTPVNGYDKETWVTLDPVPDLLILPVNLKDKFSFSGLTPGTYAVRFIARGTDGLEKTASATVTVTPATSFTVSVTPAEVNLLAGTRAEVTITLQASEGNTGNMNFAFATDAGLVVTRSGNTLTVDGSKSAKGEYFITIVATGPGGQAKTLDIPVKIQ